MIEQPKLYMLNEHQPFAYWEWGEGNSEKLLLLHGLADHGGVWTHLAVNLRDRYHLIAPDLRGHGNSFKPETGYSCNEIIADVQQLCQHLGWLKFNLLGHSWGGKLACVWATQHPEQIERLMLIDPAFVAQMPAWLSLTFPILYRILPFLKAMGPFSSREVAETTAKTFRQYQGWSPTQAAVFDYSIEPKTNGQWGSKFTVAARNGIFTEMMQVDGLVHPLTLPSLLIVPEKGLNRMAWQLQPYRTYLQNCQEVKVPGNHWPFLVEPEALSAIARQFLTDSQKVD
jgi:pimeloyl-ACP methyl ester carboxylesterase